MSDKIWIYAGYAVAFWFVWKFFGGHISSLVDYTGSLKGSGVGPDVLRPKSPRDSYFRR
jgi:hypothetical protein